MTAEGAMTLAFLVGLPRVLRASEPDAQRPEMDLREARTQGLA